MSSSAIIPHETVSVRNVKYVRSILKVATVGIQIPKSVNLDIRTHYMREILESFTEGGFDDKMAPIVVTQSPLEFPGATVIIDGQYWVSAMKLLLRDPDVPDDIKSKLENLEVLCGEKNDASPMRIQDIVIWASRVNNISGSVLHMSAWDRLVLVSSVHSDLINQGEDTNVFTRWCQVKPFCPMLSEQRVFWKRNEVGDVQPFLQAYYNAEKHSKIPSSLQGFHRRGEGVGDDIDSFAVQPPGPVLRNFQRSRGFRQSLHALLYHFPSP